MTTERENNKGNSGSPPAAVPPVSAPPATGIHTDPVDAFKCAECGETITVSGIPSFSEVNCPKCGAKASVPARLSNFLLLKLMGTGGMGGVYYARDEELGRFVAIKVMLESLGSDPAFIETFRREAQAVAKLNHPNIAQIYSYGQEKGQPYIVMELVSGERVDAMMEANGGLKPGLAMRIGLEIAQGLSAADEAGLVHGDIKPENILLDLKGRAKLVDFGLATVAHQAAGEGIWGTPYYIAPEKIRRQKVDARSDIYSLGATLFHMLTGKPPFEGETPVEVVKARLEQPPPDPRKHIPDLPEIISTTIKRMLAVDRTERYPNYLSLISDLRKSVESLGSSPAQTGRPVGGKQIRFKNRKGGTSAPPTVRSEAAGASGSNGSRKLLIHKDGQGTSTVKGNRTTRTGTAPISVSADTDAAPTPEPTPEEIEARKERGRRIRRYAWITLVTIVMLLAIAGGTTALLVHRQEEIDKRKALFALSNARGESAELYTTISNHVVRLSVLTKQAESMVTDIQNAVERMTGSRIELAPPPPPAPIPAAGAATGTATNPAPDGTTAPAPAAAVINAPAPVAPAGDAATTAAPAATGDMAEPSTAPAAHPIIDPAREGLQGIRALMELKIQADDILTDALALASAVQTSGNVAKATEDTGALREFATQAAEVATMAKARFERSLECHQKTMAIRQEFDQAETTRIAAEKAAEAARIAAEKTERERQELIARIALEIQQVKNDQTEAKGLFDTNSYEEALTQLKQRAANVQTDQGKAAIQVLIGRYEYLVQMKAALTAGMKETRYPWGWGFGNSARDIETANEKGIVVKGSATPFPWSAVTTPQMLKLVDFYLSSRTIKARARIDMAFGAAIYCDEFGQQGRDRAQQYANRAIDLGLERDTFSRLLEAGWLETTE